MKLLWLVAVAFVPYVLALDSLSECNQETNGDKWWDGFVQFSCEYKKVGAKTTRRIFPIKCRTPKGKEIAPSSNGVRESDFHFVCKQANANSMELYVEACYLPSGGARIDIGTGKHASGGGHYECIEEVHPTTNERVVKREFYKETLGCEINGKKIKVNEQINSKDNTVRLRCYKSGDSTKVVAIGCILPNGKMLSNWHASSDGKFCVGPRSGEDQKVCKLITANDKCSVTITKADGSKQTVQKKVLEKWVDGMFRYQCLYKNINKYKQDEKNGRETYVKRINCYMSYTYKQNNQDKKYDVYTWFGGIVKTRDNKWWTCRGAHGGANGEKTYSWVELKNGADYTCTFANGEKKSMWQTVTIDNVQFRCEWHSGQKKIQQKWCINPLTKKAVRHNQYSEDKTNKKAWKCVKNAQTGMLVYYELSADEYKKWKAGDSNAVSALGGGGSGSSGQEVDATPTCDDGYEVNPDDNKCHDIDECEDGLDDCLDDEVCHNMPGTFQCRCKMGLMRVLKTGACEPLKCSCPTDAPIR